MVRQQFNERYQTAGEALQALTTPPLSPFSYFVAKQRFLIGAGIIVSLILGIGLLFYVRPSTTDVQLVCPETPLPPLPSTPGRKVGSATLYYFPNEKYPTGKGIMVFPDKKYGGNIRFDGELKSGKFNGCGSYTYGNGNRYVGEFFDNNFQGTGKIIYNNGCEYIGNFKKNKPSDRGICRLKDGLHLSKIWQDNKLQAGNQTCVCE